MPEAPTLDLEQSLFAQGFDLVAGVDEVGRGSLAGPVSVGIAVVDKSVNIAPAQIRDSKQMSAKARTESIELIKDWSVARAVGSASALEIDEIGIINALRLAWTRAYDELDVKPAHVILDGKHNWLEPKPTDLFTAEIPDIQVPVTMKVKADASCASVAAASVLAKVARDQYMAELALQHPEYGWSTNVGYGSAKHLEAIRTHGLTDFHRKSWNLLSSDGQ